MIPKHHKEAALRYWSTRSPRERKLLLIWAIGLSILIVCFGVVLPVQKKINLLQARIPTLEKQLLLMRTQAPSASLRPAASTADLRSTLFEVLARKNISTDIRALSNGRIELRLPALGTQEALALAQSLRDETGAQISALQINTNTTGQGVQMVLEMGRN